ncbi:MAG: hypothetical protein F9K44_06395 [Hyphomicrobiaceae bacterium]|nr:MAG: hypothetical protein F9K44_06395 [Hyphomicrobiaceae bacterium]
MKIRKLPALAAIIFGGAVCGAAFGAPVPSSVQSERVTSTHVLTAAKAKKKVAAKKKTAKVMAKKKTVKVAKYKTCGTYMYWHKKHKKCWDARYNKAKS